MYKKEVMTKSGKYLMLMTLLGGLALGTATNKTVEAAELDSDVVQLLNNKLTQDSAITYVSNGVEQVLPVPVGSVIEFRGRDGYLEFKINKKVTKLYNVTDLTLKDITVNHLIPFYTDSVVNMTFDNVNFQKGIDISIPKALETLVVKNSTFGATDYSLAVHSAHKLTSYVIDNSTFNADVRIYSNHALEKTTISNSVMSDNVSQYSNKRGYYTDFVNNRFEYGRKRTIASGGMSPADIFYMNPSDKTVMGASRFDETQDGKIIYKKADGVPQYIDVPAGVKVTTVNDVRNDITIKLSNGTTTVLNDAKSLTFRNVDITTHVAFTQRQLLLEKLEFINSRTRLIDVAYSQTMQSFKLNRSEVSQSSGYVSVYNNANIKEFVMQDSKVNGGSGYVSVYNNKTLEDFIVNDSYTYGYLSAYNLGSSVLKLSNSKYDDYINTNQVIEGEGGHVVVGDVPELEQISNHIHPEGNVLELSDYIKAIDTEDGDISHNLFVLRGSIDVYQAGTYTITVAVTDADDNTVEMDITIVVE